MPLRSVAVLSLHTSPVAQPGVGDGGGMNIYVRSLSSALAVEAAVDELQKMAGTQFDPDVVRIFAPLSERLIPRTAA